jgi:hypothetical protein
MRERNSGLPEMDMEVKEGKVRRRNDLIRGMSEKCLKVMRGQV